MKKFRTAVESKQIQETSLAPLLNNKSLLNTVFRQYVHLPLGLVVSLLMVLSSYLADRPWQAEENLLFAFQGVAAIAFFFSFQAWRAFRNHQLQLRHSHNAFVGSGVYPMLFGGLFLYLCLPQGTAALACGAVSLALAIAYSAGRKPLQSLGLLRYQTLTLLILSLCWLPLVAPQGNTSLQAGLFLLVLGGIVGSLNHFYQALMHTAGIHHEELLADRH
jgi:hypothetical protein